MNYYLCTHSQQSLDLHFDYATRQNYPDKDIEWQAICGAQSGIGKFNIPCIDSFSDNPIGKFNKPLRQHTTLFHLLNNPNIDEFVFEQCSVFIINETELKIQNGVDFSYIDSWGAYKKNNLGQPEYFPWIRSDIDNLYERIGKQEVTEFYKANFNGFELESMENGRMLYWKCYVNNKNRHVKDMFNDLILPFTYGNNMRFFGRNLTELILAHLYRSKYQDKIVLSKTFIDKPESYYDRSLVDQSTMHYYGA